MSIFKKKKILVTHNGTFHADDLFATATLSLVYNGNIKVIRTRDEKLIKEADFVYDVGGIYNPEKNLFDHHQKGGAGVRPNGIPYSSFGLVWKAYGEKLCGSKEIADLIDRKLVQSIDAIDNGVDVVKPIFPDIMPYGADQIYLNFKPTWKESNENIDSVFNEQWREVEKLLRREIEIANSDKEGVDIMTSVYSKTEDKRIIILEIDFPRYLFQDTLSRFPEPIYLVYPSSHGDIWKVEAIRKSPETMKSRKPFPESWCGLMNEDPKLKELTGVPDATFCHRGGFLTLAKSKEGAILIAKKALET